MINWDMLVPLAGMASGLILLMPIVRSGVRYLERRGAGSDAGDLTTLRDEVRSLSDRLDAMEMDGPRLAELVERVDFAERLLARQRDARRLDGAD